MLKDVQSGEIRSDPGFRLTLLKMTLGALLAIGLIGSVSLYIRSAIKTIGSVKEAKQRATEEIDQIKPMPDSLFVRRGSTASGEHGTVTDHYRSDAEYESIRDYYLQEFKRFGWKFQRESKMPVRGEDVGAVELVFCKNG